MKSNFSFLLPALCCVFLAGCSVSQEDYDVLQSNYTSLQQEYQELNELYTTMSSDYADCSTQLEAIVNQKTEPAYTTNYIFSEQYISAATWATSSFGDNATYCEIGNISDKASTTYFQIIIPSNHSPNSAIETFNVVKSSIPMLSILNLNYDNIFIKFLYDDSAIFVEYSLSKEDTNDYILKSITGDLMNIDSIIESLGQ